MNLPAFDFQPVIVIGAARSGTNMLRDLLTRHSQVSTWPCDEINYLWRVGNASFPTDELESGQASPRTVATIRKQFARLARQRKAQWVIEKTCANSLRVDYVNAIVPEAKFLFLVRDGVDVVASATQRWRAPLKLPYVLKKAAYIPFQDVPYYATRYLRHRAQRLFDAQQCLPTWGPRFAGIEAALRFCSLEEVCALQWQRCVEHSDRALSCLPSERVLYVRYEAFVQRPTDEFARVLDFLGIEVDEAFLYNAVRHITAHSVGKGWQQLARPVCAKIEPQVAATLQQLTEKCQEATACVQVRQAA